VQIVPATRNAILQFRVRLLDDDRRIIHFVQSSRWIWTDGAAVLVRADGFLAIRFHAVAQLAQHHTSLTSALDALVSVFGFEADAGRGEPLLVAVDVAVVQTRRRRLPLGKRRYILRAAAAAAAAAADAAAGGGSATLPATGQRRCCYRCCCC